jgi:DNA ligase-1
MQRLAETAERIAATTRKSEKVAIVAEFLRSLEIEEAAMAALFLSGKVFPGYEERTLQVGGALLWRSVIEVSRRSDADLTAAYRKHGDLGDASYQVLISAKHLGPGVALAEVADTFEQIAATRGPAGKAKLVVHLLAHATALEAKYIVKIITGELRIGSKESLLEEAIAKTYDAPLADVQRANMMLGDIAGTLRLADEGKLNQARMRMFHPIGFMLASPAETAQEAFEYFQHAAVEDKYDGIRAQAHISQGKVQLFSRTLDDITGSFPELVAHLAAFADEVVVDGEIVAWDFPGDGGPGYAKPFSQIQKRLGRKRVTREMMAEVPVAYVVFDLIYAGGELVIDRPLTERSQVLGRVFADSKLVISVPAEDPQGALIFEPAVTSSRKEQPRVLRAPVLFANSTEQIETLFEAALARGNEGLMIKDLSSPYTPGRRGRTWLKLKRELATLDVVVTAAEWGHGKRINVLSDYTFAVKKGDELVNIGKAYSGLTDAEIAEMTEYFLAHTTNDRGFVRDVEPKLVLEVAFNAIMKSDRHNSGYALRFPRILRIRKDKLAEDIDTIEIVEQIYARQHGVKKTA